MLDLKLEFCYHFHWADNNSWRPKIMWINNSTYYPGKLTNLIETTRRPMRWSKRRPTIGRLSVDCRSTVGILSLNVYLGEEVFVLYCEINLSQMQFYLPLITNSNSRRKSAFFFLSCVWQPHSFREFYIVRRYWWIFILCDCYSKTKVWLILTWRELLERNIPCL